MKKVVELEKLTTEELAEYIEELKKEQKDLDRKMRDFDSEKRLFEQKLELLKISYTQLAEEKRSFEKEKKRFESDRASFHTYSSMNMGSRQERMANVSLLFSGVTNLLALKKRYKDLIKIYHPDNLCGDKEMLQMINREYELLQLEFERRMKNA